MLQTLRHESSSEQNLDEMATFNVLVHHIRPVWYSCSQVTRMIFVTWVEPTVCFKRNVWSTVVDFTYQWHVISCISGTQFWSLMLGRIQPRVATHWSVKHDCSRQRDFLIWRTTHDIREVEWEAWLSYNQVSRTQEHSNDCYTKNCVNK